MSRRHHPAEEAEEMSSGWMWDRYKGGGGGAPLKDVSGGTVTNLRGVIRGSVEVNHNPSVGSPSKWKGVRHDDSDSHDSGHSDNSDEVDRHRSRNRRNQDDRRGRSRSTDRSNRKNDERRRIYTPEIPGLTINTSPKKGLGSALKDMNASESVSEKEFRNRKELEYQNQLRQQIEEKRKMKEIENKKIALIKHKELEEYYFLFYKGNVPSHIKKELKQASRKLHGDDDDEIDGENNYNRSDDRKSSDRRESSKHTENYDEPLRTSRSEKSKTERTRSTSRGRNEANYDSDTDAQDKRKSSRSGDQGWVSQTEYDELSALCEKLLQQQKDLQIEIRNQAKVINELQKQSGAPMKGSVFSKQGRNNAVDSDNISVGSKSVRSKSAVARSRIVDTKGTNKNNVAVQQPKAPNGERRPSSTHSLGSRNRAVSKDRFGNKIEPKEVAAPTKLKNLRVNGQSSPGKAPPLKLKSINFSHDDEPPSNVRNGGGAGNGFQKLASMRSGGPIVAVHDENIDYNERNVQPTKSALKKSNAGASSIELNGNSEMLRIGGEEVDMISGDQLDRLLVQAKKARAPAGPAYNRFANFD